MWQLRHSDAVLLQRMCVEPVGTVHEPGGLLAGHAQVSAMRRLWNPDADVQRQLQLARVVRLLERRRMHPGSYQDRGMRQLRNENPDVYRGMLVGRLVDVQRRGRVLPRQLGLTGMRKLRYTEPNLYQQLRVAQPVGRVYEPGRVCTWNHRLAGLWKLRHTVSDVHE